MRFIFLSTFVFCMIGSTVVSCIYGTCDPVPPYFEIKGIKSYNMRFTNSGLNPWETLDANENIHWKNFFIRFGFQKNYIAQNNLELPGALIALTCDEAGHAGDKIGVDTVIIRTIYNYNEAYSAGDVINNIILTNIWTFNVENFYEFIPLQDYLMNNKEGVLNDVFEMKLTEAPAPNAKFSVELMYQLNNGEIFTHTTETINLN